MEDSGPAEDPRPPIWVGHVGPIHVADLEVAVGFYRALGLRPAVRLDHMASMEMRGGTQLVIYPNDPSDGPAWTEGDGPLEAPFDLMVDDIDGARDGLVAAGLAPEPMEELRNHRRFYIQDPDGHRIAVLDSHVVGPV